MNNRYTNEGVNNGIDNMIKEIEQLQHEITLLQQSNADIKVQRDKAVVDLRKHANCWVCKNQNGLFTCELTAECGKELKHWQWRGLEESE